MQISSSFARRVYLTGMFLKNRLIFIRTIPIAKSNELN